MAALTIIGGWGCGGGGGSAGGGITPPPSHSWSGTVSDHAGHTGSTTWTIQDDGSFHADGSVGTTAYVLDGQIIGGNWNATGTAAGRSGNASGTIAFNMAAAPPTFAAQGVVIYSTSTQTFAQNIWVTATRAN